MRPLLVMLLRVIAGTSESPIEEEWLFFPREPEPEPEPELDKNCSSSSPSQSSIVLYSPAYILIVIVAKKNMKTEFWNIIHNLLKFLLPHGSWNLQDFSQWRVVILGSVIGISEIPVLSRDKASNCRSFLRSSARRASVVPAVHPAKPNLMSQTIGELSAHSLLQS